MSATVMIVDDEEKFRENIRTFLTSLGYEAIGAATVSEARVNIQQGKADVILLDVMLPDGYGPDLLEEITKLEMRPPVIMITGNGDIDMAVKAMKDGAVDFLQKPVKLDRLEEAVTRAAEIFSMRRELAHLRHANWEDSNFIIGTHPEMRRIVDVVQRAAEASATILITGETGTGKEVLVDAIRHRGPRAGKPYVSVNCGAIQTTLLESELFGHEPYAFTTAEKRKYGLMEVADEGILFLDEISSMPIDMQPKLLRALEERAFRRVGGTTMIKVDVQLITASNRSLEEMVEENTFRSDLYYRLKVVHFHLPPLRERKQDIPQFVALFISQISPRLGKNITDVTPRALEALNSYYWRGNIRELRNAIEHACLFCDEASIDLPHLPSDIINPKDYPR
jgi:two-component system, NtrC family, response regulator AtoC